MRLPNLVRPRPSFLVAKTRSSVVSCAGQLSGVCQIHACTIRASGSWKNEKAKTGQGARTVTSPFTPSTRPPTRPLDRGQVHVWGVRTLEEAQSTRHERAPWRTARALHAASRLRRRPALGAVARVVILVVIIIVVVVAAVAGRAGGCAAPLAAVVVIIFLICVKRRLAEGLTRGRSSRLLLLASEHGLQLQTAAAATHCRRVGRLFSSAATLRALRPRVKGAGHAPARRGV